MATTVTGRATDFITFSRTSNATLVASDGKIKWAGHNLVLNSASPATQTVTVISGAQYTVEMTGSGSIALSGAGSGTVSSGSPVTVTASSTSLTLTISGTVSTMWAYRSDLGGMVANPATSTTYYPTTSAAYYAPRLDFDPVTLAARGLLVEELRANIVTPSSAFSGWVSASASVLDNQVTAPDGTTTAGVLTATGANGEIYRQVTSTSGVAHTGSIYVKRKTGTGSIFLIDAAGARILVTATITTTDWTRITVTANSVSTGPFFGIRLGTSGDEVYIWGAQFEVGSFATSYIPTGASTATRTADVASVSTQAFPYSSSEGTLVVNFSSVNSSSAQITMDDGNSGYDNYRSLYFNYGSGDIAVFEGSGGGSFVTNSTIYNGPSSTNFSGKAAYAYASASAGAAVNGAAASLSASGSPAANLSRLGLGRDYGYGGADGIVTGAQHLRQITYIPRRLSNAELQSRTA